MVVITVSSKGQIVIPREIRRRMRLERGAKVEIQMRGDTLELRPVRGVRARDDWRRWRGAIGRKGITKELEADHAREIAEGR